MSVLYEMTFVVSKVVGVIGVVVGVVDVFLQENNIPPINVNPRIAKLNFFIRIVYIFMKTFFKRKSWFFILYNIPKKAIFNTRLIR